MAGKNENIIEKNEKNKMWFKFLFFPFFKV